MNSTTSKRLRPASALRDFLNSEAAGGILLMLAAAGAMLIANSPFGRDYFAAFEAKLGPLSLHHWINDGLMSLFFLLVGLEIKREFLDGNLARWPDRTLPIVAAAAGMAAPALVYLAGVRGTPGLGAGWAIPSATDIAFAIGVLALLGRRAPASLKLFLATVAIVDDVGAVLVIAFFYTSAIDLAALSLAAAILAAMVMLGRLGVLRLWPYLALMPFLWAAVFASGVHATVAGVLAALAVPLRPTPGAPDAPDSPLHRLEHALSRPVALAIVPLFGFANAGVSLEGVGLAQLAAPLPLAVGLGLFLGKQAGVFASVRLAVALGVAARPAGASWLQLYGVALLCGIGFTMSLFIGGLAFRDPALFDQVKIGVLAGSILSALAGAAVLSLARRPR